MTRGAKDLFASERGVFTIFVVLVALVLVIIGKITGAEWLSFAKWVAIALVLGKTASNYIDANTSAAPPPPPA